MSTNTTAMSQPATLKIEIGLDGTTQVSVNGLPGKGCKDATRAIENALGETTSDRTTAEFYEAPVEVNNVIRR